MDKDLVENELRRYLVCAPTREFVSGVIKAAEALQRGGAGGESVPTDVTMLPAYCAMLDALGYTTELKYTDAAGQRELAEQIAKADARAEGVSYQGPPPALRKVIESIEECCDTTRARS